MRLRKELKPISILTASLIRRPRQSERKTHRFTGTLAAVTKVPSMSPQKQRMIGGDAIGLPPAHPGRFLDPQSDQPRVFEGRTQPPPPPGPDVIDQSKEFDYREVAKKLKQDYVHGTRDASIRHLDALHSLIKYLMKADPNLDEMLDQTARLVYTQFSIKEVSIALRSASDGRYRYVAEHGMRTDVWAAHNKISYTYDDINDTKKYKAVTISHHTKLYLAEDNPYGPDEGDTYSEHMMKQSKRKSAADSREGDYLDIFIYGPANETYGWIEISGTWDGKVPDAKAVRCLETISSVLGIAITRHNMASESEKASKTPEQPKKAEQTKM